MRAHNTERRDVTVLHAVRWLLLHLSEDVTNDLGRVVGGFGGTGDLMVALVGWGVSLDVLNLFQVVLVVCIGHVSSLSLWTSIAWRPRLNSHALVPSMSDSSFRCLSFHVSLILAPSSFPYDTCALPGNAECARCEQTYINSNIAQLRPAHRMIQVVFAKVVLRQIRNVGKLHMRNVRRS
jgi:hypothetical protein